MGPEAINRIWTYFGTLTLAWTVLAAMRVRAKKFGVGLPILGNLTIPELVIFTIPVAAICILFLHSLLRANARASDEVAGSPLAHCLGERQCHRRLVPWWPALTCGLCFGCFRSFRSLR